MQRSLSRSIIISFFTLAAAQAAPISLGFITFNRFGAGTSNYFQVNNWTGGIVTGYDVVSTVDFLDVSLTVDYASVTDEAVDFSGPMTPRYQSYGSEGILSALPISRAVFRANLNPAAVWTLKSGSVFVPQRTALEMVLLPSSGGSLVADYDAWEIVVDDNLSGTGSVPEPAAWLLSGGGLLGLGLVRKLFPHRA